MRYVLLAALAAWAVGTALGWSDPTVWDVTNGAALAMAGFGAPFRALPGPAVTAAATPPSGMSEEAIWDQRYDTQPFTSATTTRLTFFTTINPDRTLTNMQQAGTLPSPWALQIHMITADYLFEAPVSTAATGVDGVLNDLASLILSSGARPTWTLNINNKDYGPYSLTVLHGTGGPQGWGWGGAIETNQFARNTEIPGWNYFGRVIILTQAPFYLTTEWANPVTLTHAAAESDPFIRVSLFGVLNRRVQ